MLKFHFSLTILFLSFVIKAQDVHWSQILDNPLFLNPANTGNHDANHRIISAYKDQWRSVTKPFQTFSLSYDTKLTDKNLGLSLVFLNDKVGDGAFKTIEFFTAPSYFIYFNDKHQFSSSLQFGINHRQFDFTKFYFDEQYNGVAYDPNLPITENLASESKLNLNLGTGFVYSFNNSKNKIDVGVSFNNLNQPNHGFYGEKVKRDVRNTIYFNYSRKIDEKLEITPSLFNQHQGKFNEIIAGLNAKYELNKKMNTKLQLGALVRLKDAFIILTAIQHKSYRIGISYDVNISTLNTVSRKRGGLELNFRYLIYLFKPKKVQYRICPEFI